MSRYGGAYEPKDVGEAEDVKPQIEAKCHSGCTKSFDLLQKCEARIEEKGSGECSGWYMDYLHCIDKCSSKLIFKTLM
eukprot:CAMPEP_0183331146 /NCGR_PEP_ID=MMETSP0164_2-20130417/548_1 /TAXON_ID=221442 /ORGANISM="Coccolithus pelagicus ssp braarudi, Strain PLY182g" /LENGTH=77 /DNA_ID=CAMNT_0025499533 /DNA_START=41 /DNA_END=274 /DNA_ORIENTATION=-